MAAFFETQTEHSNGSIFGVFFFLISFFSIASVQLNRARERTVIRNMRWPQSFGLCICCSLISIWVYFRRRRTACRHRRLCVNTEQCLRFQFFSLPKNQIFVWVWIDEIVFVKSYVSVWLWFAALSSCLRLSRIMRSLSTFLPISVSIFLLCSFLT